MPITLSITLVKCSSATNIIIKKPVEKNAEKQSSLREPSSQQAKKLKQPQQRRSGNSEPELSCQHAITSL